MSLAPRWSGRRPPPAWVAECGLLLPAARITSTSFSTWRPGWRRMYGFATSFFFSSRRRHTRLVSDWSSDVCSSDLGKGAVAMERIGSDDAPVEAQQIQHFQSTPRLVATGRFLLSQSHPGIHRKDIDQMQRVRPPATFVGSAQGLAVDRHHPGKLEPIRLGKARHKLPEGELEGLRF